MNSSGDAYLGSTIRSNEDCQDYIGYDDPLSHNEIRSINGSNDWFPALKFIESEHRINGMNHGSKKEYQVDTSKSEKRYGKCGYCKWSVGNNSQCLRKFNYVRKYLQSYSCNDGRWSFEWYNSDSNYRNACDDDNWDYDLECAGTHETGENHPSKSYLGGCAGGNKDSSFNFNNLQDYY